MKRALGLVNQAGAFRIFNRWHWQESMMLTASPVHLAAQPEPPAQPCSRLVSTAIDRVLIAIDNQPPAAQRLLLLLAKRLIETRIPATLQGGR